MRPDGAPHLRDPAESLLRVEHLVVEFPVGRNRCVKAVSDVSFDVCPGETVGIVGESGSGKSTLARAIVQVPPPTEGTVIFEGKDLTALRGEELRRQRARLQFIFQDPISSLNPRRRVRDIVSEGLKLWGDAHADRAAVVKQVLETVGLDAQHVGDRHPHEFSGGQCQRIAIARAVAIEPALLICDEPVAALDVSVQAQVLNLLGDMKDRYGLTMVFISHDLAVMKVVSDRIVVMYLGKVCEIAPAESLYANPHHPYTQQLLAAVPSLDPGDRSPPIKLVGEPPSPIDPPSGCRFRTRCPRAELRCELEEPAIREVEPGHFAACHLAVAASCPSS